MGNTYDSDEIREMIREAGLRCTSSRSTVLEYLIGCSAPRSHADISEDLVPEGHDQATIYRNLTDLTEAGLLQRLDLGDHVWRFEFRSHEDDDDDHSHFVCTDCGEVSCLEPVGLSFEEGETSSGLVGEVDEVFLKGRCTECA